MILFPDFLLAHNPSTFGKHNDPANENLQMETIHETYPSVIKQSLIYPSLDPSIFKVSLKLFEIFSPTDTILNFETILKYQKKDPVLRIIL